jgi:hypothetical protein
VIMSLQGVFYKGTVFGTTLLDDKSLIFNIDLIKAGNANVWLSSRAYVL